MAEFLGDCFFFLRDSMGLIEDFDRVLFCDDGNLASIVVICPVCMKVEFTPLKVDESRSCSERHMIGFPFFFYPG